MTRSARDAAVSGAIRFERFREDEVISSQARRRTSKLDRLRQDLEELLIEHARPVRRPRRGSAIFRSCQSLFPSFMSACALGCAQFCTSAKQRSNFISSLKSLIRKLCFLDQKARRAVRHLDLKVAESYSARCA